MNSIRTLTFLSVAACLKIHEQAIPRSGRTLAKSVNCKNEVERKRNVSTR